MTLYFPDLVGLGAFVFEVLLCLKYASVMSDPLRVFMLMGACILLLLVWRMTQQVIREDHPFQPIIDWWAALALVPFYLNLNQIMDATRRPLMDQWLISMDQRLFGLQPAVWFSGHQSPWLTEWLFLCYTSYFALVALTGVLLRRAPDKRPFQAYLAAIALTFTLQMFGYVAVPAIGPRFVLADQMLAPLKGVFFSQYLESSFKRVQFLRDCFPSGHTGQTLVAMYFSMRYLSRRYATAVAVVGVSIVVATLYCQMHYAFDLVVAAPVALVGVVSCELFSRRARMAYHFPALVKYAYVLRRK